MVWWLSCVVVLSGCGAAATFRPPLDAHGWSAADRQARLALGHVEGDPAGDPAREVERLRAIAVLEERAGNATSAIAATTRAVAVARARTVLAPEASRDEARQVWIVVRREALARAERLGDLALALAAVGRDAPGDAREIVARLLRLRADAGGGIARPIPIALWSALDDTARFDVERLAGVPRGATRVPVDRVAGEGARALGVLEHRLVEAGEREDGDAVLAAARALVSIDRAHPLASAVLLVAREGDREAAIDVVGSASPSRRGVAIARLLQAVQARPGSAAHRLALAARCLDEDLAGDAYDLALEARALAHDDDARRLADAIAALATLVTADAERFEAWERASGVSRSPSTERRLAEWAGSEMASKPLLARAARAQRTLVELGVSHFGATSAVAADATADESLRALALGRMWALDRPAARVFAECAREGLRWGECGERQAWLDESWWEDDEELERRPRDLDELVLPAPELFARDEAGERAQAWLTELEASRHGLHPLVVEARVRVLARSGDHAGARGALEDAGRALPWSRRAVLALWLEDLAAGREVALDVLDQALLLGSPAERIERGEAHDEHEEIALDASNVARLATAEAHFDEPGHEAQVLDALAPLIERGDASALYAAALSAIALQRAGRAEELARLVERVRTALPGSALDRLLEAVQVQLAGEARAARDAYAGALVAWPESRDLVRRWFAAWSAGEPSVALETARAALASVDPSAMDLAFDGPVASVAELSALLQPAPGGDLEVATLRAGGPAMSRTLGVSYRLRALIERAITQAPDAATAIASVRELVPFATSAAEEQPRWRRARVRMHLLLGETERALEIADRASDRERDLENDAPLLDDDVLRSIAAARSALDDTTVWRLIAADARNEAATTEALDGLAARAGTSPAVRALLCQELTTSSEHAPRVIDECGPAFRADPSQLMLAQSLSWAVLEASEHAQARGLAPAAFFEITSRVLGDRTPGVVLHNHSIWLSRNGDHERAAALELAAQARGWVVDEITRDDLAQLRWRGPSVRASYVAGGQASWSELAFQSLGDARLAAASIYADAGTAWARAHPQDEGSVRAFAAADVVAWAQADLDAGHLTPEGLVAFDATRIDDFDDRTDALVGAYPESIVVAYAAMVRALRRNDHEAALRWGSIVERAGVRGTYVVTITPALMALRGRAELDALRARGREAFPDDPRLSGAAEAEAALPTPLGSAEAFEAALAAIDVGRMLARPRGLERRASVQHAVEVTLPSWLAPLGGAGGEVDGARIAVVSEPRQSDCTPETCLDALVPAMERTGFRHVWSAPVTLPIGLGARALMTNGTHVMVLGVVPRGARLVVSILAGPTTTVVPLLPTFALAEATMRPLDGLVGAAWAEALRGAASAVPSGLRARALRAALAPGEGCPITSELDETRRAGAALAAALASDVLLATPDTSARRRLLACVPEGAGDHGALGVAAVLDPDPAIHARGRALMSADRAGALAAARAVVHAPVTVAASGLASRADTALPPLGAVEVLASLPIEERRTLTTELLDGGDRRLALLALVSEQVLPGGIAPEALARIVTTGDAALAIEAVHAHWNAPSTAELDAIRTRVDAMRAPLEDEQRALLRTAAWVLSRGLDPRDRERFTRMAALAREGLSPEDAPYGESAARNVEWHAETHAAALQRAPIEQLEERFAPHAEWLRAQRARSRVSPEAARLLATEPLARFLPGTHWRYVRVPQPSLMIATLTSAYERLDSAGSTDAAVARAAFAWMAEHAGAELLGPEGGLDLDRPIECAMADRWPRSWVCSVHVRDADRARAILARRRIGTNSAPWLAVDAANLARTLPMVAGATPFALDRMLRVDPDAADSSEGGGGRRDGGALLFAERARVEVSLDGVRFDRFATFVRREHEGSGVDTEHYLFTGDRMIVFGLEEMARAVVTGPLPIARTLAGDPTFRRLTEDWADGAALQMASVGWRSESGSEMPLVEREDASFEIAVEGTGLVLRMRAPFAGTPGDVGPLVAMLPTDATARFAIAGATEDDAPRARRREPEAPIEPRPPLRDAGEAARLASDAAERLAFAWMPRAGGELWDRWVIVAEGTALDRALAARGITPPAEGTLVEQAGVRFARRGARWVVGPIEADVRAALARPLPTQGGEVQVGSGRLDGLGAARALIGLVGALPEGDPRRTQLQMFAALLGAGRELSFDGHVDTRRRQLVVVAHVEPTLRAEGSEHIIDEVLRNPRNAVRLPRPIEPIELRAPLRLVLESDEPETVAARVFVRGARSRTRVIDPRHLEVVITPAPGEGTDVAIDDAARARLTRGLGSDAPRVRALAAQIVPAGARPEDAARAVVAWVHENIRYELTAEELDAASVLARGRGDCSELSRLSVALLRAAGVPAELREGFAIDGQEAVAHAWVAFHDGRGFREVDPTNGNVQVSSGYVPASVWSAVGLLSVGGLRVVEVGPVP
ncbi:transglutaminase domain-containing protein [Sandaracinus amylolyticus]|uniref:transglutaminase domain-containing protein n=1 Tax=Sandaracinus amylolyticus TaxID=927083 RepID=UPI001F1FC06B|nr:transglutaminase domain-containing protein [Sandaracinus amylolyticus]